MKNEHRPPENFDVALRLRKLVIEAGGNTKFCRKINMPVMTLNNYLGGRDIPLQTAKKIADCSGVSIDWLANGESNDAIEVRQEVLQGVTAASLAAKSFCLQLGIDWFNKVAILTELYLRDRESNKQTSVEK